MKEVTLERAMEIIDDYLNAGSKEQRQYAHEKGREIYEAYYGKEYVNRSEREKKYIFWISQSHTAAIWYFSGFVNNNGAGSNGIALTTDRCFAKKVPEPEAHMVHFNLNRHSYFQKEQI